MNSGVCDGGAEEGSGEVKAGDQPVVVYCQHGPRAVIAKFALRLAGHTDVRYLEGHMSGWEKTGLPLETAPPD